MKALRLAAFLIGLGSAVTFGVQVGHAQDAAGVAAHLAAAKKAVGSDHAALYRTVCARFEPPSAATAGGARGGRGAGAAADAAPPPAPVANPVKVFDNLYWLGGVGAVAWAIDTPDGIIITDPLYDYQVQPIVVGGLQKLGLDPKRIRYVVINHGHGDHYAGARFLQDTYGARVMMPQVEWDYIERRAVTDEVARPRPRRDMVVTDGQKFTLGGTTITFYITPGHTPGTTSPLITVTDRGRPHVAAMWGGTGWTEFEITDPDDKKRPVYQAYYDSAVRYRDLVTKAGADVIISNHGQYDNAVAKNALLAKRGPNDPHPWVIGTQRTADYVTVAAECAATGLASVRR